MKKLLQIFIFLGFSSLASAQVFWQEYATGFASASRGINQISYANSNDVWATAYDGSGGAVTVREFTKSTDGGVTWTAGSINVANTLGIGCISAVSGTTAFVAVFPDVPGASGGGVYKTTDSGVTWNRQNSASYNATASFADVIHFWDENVGFTVGDPDSPTTYEGYSTVDGGSTWVRIPAANIPVPVAGEYFYTRGIYVQGDNVWCGTNKGRIFKSNNRGLNWVVNTVPGPVADFQNGQYSFQSATDGILTDDGNNFWRSSDGGMTWIPEIPLSPIRDGKHCFVPGENNVWVVIGQDADLAVRGSSYSCDKGVNNTDINGLGDDSNVDNPTAVSFFNGSNGLAAGFSTTITEGGIFKYVGTQLASCNSVSTTKFSTSGYSIAPNPTNGLVELKGTNINQVLVTDMLGKVVSNNTYSSLSNVTIDMTSYNTGIYLVKVTNNEGTVSTAKVVKQ